jgi:hypothetical protein
MPLPVADVLVRIDDLLGDADRVRWTAAERIRWMNEAMGAIMTRRPQAFAVNQVIPLVAGTLQTLPAANAQLLDVVRNMGANGTTPGKVIRRTDRQLLDDSDPNWHTTTASASIKHYTFDDRTPSLFYTYPPAVAGTQVEVSYAKLPQALAENATTGSLEIGAEYLEPVVNFVCYRCHSKDSEYAVSALAVAYYQAFESALGIKNQTESASSPNQPSNSV